jgi:hypothetical protein
MVDDMGLELVEIEPLVAAGPFTLEQCFFVGLQLVEMIDEHMLEKIVRGGEWLIAIGKFTSKCFACVQLERFYIAIVVAVEDLETWETKDPMSTRVLRKLLFPKPLTMFLSVFIHMILAFGS